MSSKLFFIKMRRSGICRELSESSDNKKHGDYTINDKNSLCAYVDIDVDKITENVRNNINKNKYKYELFDDVSINNLIVEMTQEEIEKNVISEVNKIRIKILTEKTEKWEKGLTRRLN
jgi:ketol-acid reductoisomerase